MQRDRFYINNYGGGLYYHGSALKSYITSICICMIKYNRLFITIYHLGLYMTSLCLSQPLLLDTFLQISMMCLKLEVEYRPWKKSFRGLLHHLVWLHSISTLFGFQIRFIYRLLLVLIYRFSTLLGWSITVVIFHNCFLFLIIFFHQR